MPDAAEDGAKYVPRPMNTDGVELGPDLDAVVELLAENSHDLWARRRMAEGWRHGPERDEGRREHPDLTSYSALPECEKELDRTMVVETLKAMLALGFRVVPPERPSHAAPAGRATSELSELLTSDAVLDVTALAAIWKRYDEMEWRRAPELYSLLASRFIRLGDPLLAYEVLAAADRAIPGRDTEREHLRGLALVRGGAWEEGSRVAGTLRDTADGDRHLLEEVQSLLGRTHKDLGLAAATSGERRFHLERAFDAYADAARRSGGSYPLINAAATAFLLDRTDLGREFALRARDAAATEIRQSPDDYWPHATLGEALLLLGHVREAEGCYRRYLQIAGSDFGSIASTRRQARLLSEHLGADRSWIDRVFRIPSVVVFAGHMIDRPGRRPARLPPSRVSELRSAIDARLEECRAGFGFSAAACGSDILFLEAMGTRGGETHVVLPYPSERFIRDSVALEPTAGWVPRFHEVCNRAVEVVVASGSPFPAGSIGFDYSNLLMLGLAVIKSRSLDAELVPLAVWDGRDTREGTAAVVRQWRDLGYEVQIIPPPRGRRG